MKWLFLILIVLLVGCNPTIQNNEEVCGYYNEPCCVDYTARDPFGNLQPIAFCYDGLECRAETCVEGADYQAYGRP
jgi:hypothetical protein